jgi:hypothetical protein
MARPFELLHASFQVGESLYQLKVSVLVDASISVGNKASSSSAT